MRVDFGRLIRFTIKHGVANEKRDTSQCQEVLVTDLSGDKITFGQRFDIGAGGQAKVSLLYGQKVFDKMDNVEGIYIRTLFGILADTLQQIMDNLCSKAGKI